MFAQPRLGGGERGLELFGRAPGQRDAQRLFGFARLGERGLVRLGAGGQRFVLGGGAVEVRCLGTDLRVGGQHRRFVLSDLADASVEIALRLARTEELAVERVEPTAKPLALFD